MKTTDFIKESIGEDADNMHRDHEVQMARGDCYNAAKYAIELHKMLHHVAEQRGLDGWVSEKITLANDYLRTVWEYLNHEMAMDEQPEMPVFSFESAEKNFEKILAEGEPGDLESELERQEYERDAERDAEAEKEMNNEDAVDDFLARGGQIQYGKTHKPRKGEKTDYGSRHIGGRRDAVAGRAGKTIGRAANTNFKGGGKPVVTADVFGESASVGGVSAGAFATGPAAGLGRPTTGKPKKVGNVIKRSMPKFGKGVY